MDNPNDSGVSVSTMPQNPVPQPPILLPSLSSLSSSPLVPSPAPSPLNPLAYVPPTSSQQSPHIGNTYSSRSRPSSRSRSKSPSPYPESRSSRPTATATDATTPILPPIKDLVGRSPSPFDHPGHSSQAPKITLPPISQTPNAAAPGADGEHYVFGSSSGSTTLSSPQPARFAPSPKRSPTPAPLVFSSSYSTSHAVAGVGGAVYEAAPRSPSFLLNASKPLPPPPALPAAPPPVSPTYPRSPGFMSQQLGKGKRRASPPSPMNLNATEQGYPAQAAQSPRTPSMYGNNLPDTPVFGSRSASAVMSPAPLSPGLRPLSRGRLGDGVAGGSNDAPLQREGNGNGNGNGYNEGGQRLSVAADARMSLGNPLPWAHIMQAMTDEQQELEDAEAAEQAEGSIIVDSDEVATDAGYESDNVSSASTSLASTVRDYAFENGRRYHKFREGRYNFPNDDVEQEREDMKHAMVKMLCQHLHFAPIGNHPQNILDIGTGTGIWAIEMGDQFSSASVLGIDLSPIQPDWVPPNVRFMVDDVESAWLHPRNHFDYIHSRHTVMAIKDWPRLFRRSLEHLRPGGWIELQEIHHFPSSADNSMPPDHPVAQYWGLINQGLSTLGVDFYAAAGGKLANMMRDCGFVNVTERVFHVPIGIWPKNKVLKTVGLYWRTILLDGIQAIALGPLTRGCRWNREQVEVFLVNVRRAYHDNSCHMYMPLHIVYGQKPESGGGWY